MKIDIERLKTDSAYWDECGAPEDATHAHAVRARFLRKITGGWWIWCSPAPGHGFWGATSWPSANPEHIIPRPAKLAEPEWDGEGLPPVGCECEGRADPGYPWLRGVVMYSSSDGAVFKPSDGGKELFWLYRTLNAEFRPIRTKEQRQRKELEKAVENALKRVHCTESDKGAASRVAYAILSDGWRKE